ncbi:MAG TPA: MBL fold metallo-hydrolase [Patescibacteria group bacterium]|nr:MBL fold metallo-hydrolase [Patescibacteria group bacterium]
MKITKFNHSCLLVQDSGKNTLIDPGNYSEGTLIVEKLPPLEYLLITHEHMDHFSLPLVEKIVWHNPQIKIITTSSVVSQLANKNLTATDKGDDYISVEKVPHEKVWGGNPGQNIMVTVGGKLTHPGDSHSFSNSSDILALPITAPWGSTTAAVELAIKLKPKVVIPIHDYMLKDESRRTVYEWIAGYLESQGIDFKKIESKETIEV